MAAAIFPKQVVEFMKTRSGRLDVSLDESFSGSGSGRRPCRSCWDKETSFLAAHQETK